jgi:hypothetical protein
MNSQLRMMYTSSLFIHLGGPWWIGECAIFISLAILPETMAPIKRLSSRYIEHVTALFIDTKNTIPLEILMVRSKRNIYFFQEGDSSGGFEFPDNNLSGSIQSKFFFLRAEAAVEASNSCSSSLAVCAWPRHLESGWSYCPSHDTRAQSLFQKWRVFCLLKGIETRETYVSMPQHCRRLEFQSRHGTTWITSQ